MRILALETSDRSASVAALEGDALADSLQLVREIALPHQARTAQMLAPCVRDLLAEIAWPISTIGLVAVTVGPGSFTGLRIGVTTAKTLAYALGAQVIGVHTLEAIARQAPPAVAPLWVITEAQRQEFFAAKFDSERRMIGGTQIASQAEFLAALQPGDFVTGTGLRRLAPSLPVGARAVDESLWQPMAEAVGQVGWRDYCAGRRDDPWKLLPQYYRQSAAEEKAKAKQ